MGGEGNGFYLKFKLNKVSRFSTRKKKKSSFLPHTDYHNSLRLCVCIQSSASAQGYLCSIIDAHHREGVRNETFFFSFDLASISHELLMPKQTFPSITSLACHTDYNEHYSERGKKTAATLPEAMLLGGKCFETTTHLSTSEDRKCVVCVRFIHWTLFFFFSTPFCRIGGSSMLMVNTKSSTKARHFLLCNP